MRNVIGTVQLDIMDSLRHQELSVQDAAREVGCRYRSAERALRRLHERGYVKYTERCVRRGSRGRFSGTLPRLYSLTARGLAEMQARVRAGRQPGVPRTGDHHLSRHRSTV